MTAIVEHTPARGRIAAIGIAAALTAFTAIPASAAPISAASAEKLQAATSPVENVRCGKGCAIGAGVAAGVIAGAVIANQAQRNNYYYDSGPGPVYYGGGYAPQRSSRCWVETNPYRGTGYWARC